MADTEADKPEETKAEEPKAEDTKAADTKAADTKAADTKAADTKAAETKAKADADAAGKEKAKIKAQIHALKTKRNAAIEAHDSKQLKWTRINIKRLKQKVRQVSA